MSRCGGGLEVESKIKSYYHPALVRDIPTVAMRASRKILGEPSVAKNRRASSKQYNTTSSSTSPIADLPLVKMTIETIVTDPSLKMALETSKQAREHAIALLDLSSSHSSAADPTREIQLQISKQQKILLAYLAQLRGSHRDAHVGARETKALTAEARQEVDRLHLQLQNLYYEQRYLQGEISACESYEYVYSSMILVSA